MAIHTGRPNSEPTSCPWLRPPGWAAWATSVPGSCSYHSAQHQHSLLLVGTTAHLPPVQPQMRCAGPRSPCHGSSHYAGATHMGPSNCSAQVGGGAVTVGHDPTVPAVGPVLADAGLQVPVPRPEPGSGPYHLPCTGTAPTHLMLDYLSDDNRPPDASLPSGPPSLTGPQTHNASDP